MSAAVEIYTRPGCGYCSAAKALLQRKHIEFTEFDAGQNPAFRQEMLARAKGGTTFPQIFIDGFHVGGCDELYALEGAGKLDELLNGQKEPT
ncbi:glutaredoxin 3 [Afipia felis]|uniref:Glutaredoxin n=2 Tax=Afipia felis TaxID=1035 RepID=A0A380W3C7_AFIFE|nr:glutaredoxin 3 [Afipia felis]EKS30630.1 glutaredoxin 3 [Afipia felis ATCC 53690]SUU75375.1 Glutaredoxin-3 [Afipia felis]SUU83442.1 Glutaredoxin-3 [Afipia felis]